MTAKKENFKKVAINIKKKNTHMGFVAAAAVLVWSKELCPQHIAASKQTLAELCALVTLAHL